MSRGAVPNVDCAGFLLIGTHCYCLFSPAGTVIAILAEGVSALVAAFASLATPVWDLPGAKPAAYWRFEPQRQTRLVDDGMD